MTDAETISRLNRLEARNGVTVKQVLKVRQLQSKYYAMQPRDAVAKLAIYSVDLQNLWHSNNITNLSAILAGKRHVVRTVCKEADKSSALPTNHLGSLSRNS